MRKIIITFKMAIRDARTNLMHTLLSVLGVVIGVVALVSILSLIDGMEKYANDQINKTASLETIMITVNTTGKVDGIKIAKNNYDNVDQKSFYELRKVIGDDAKSVMYYGESGWLNEADTSQRKPVFTKSSDGRC